MTNASYASGALEIRPAIELDDDSVLHPRQWKGKMLIRAMAGADGAIARIEPDFPDAGIPYLLTDRLITELNAFVRAYPQHAIAGEVEYYDDFGNLPLRLTVRRTEQGNRLILTPGYHVLNGGWNWPNEQEWGLEVSEDGSVPEPVRRWED